jgi:hypothetical protein
VTSIVQKCCSVGGAGSENYHRPSKISVRERCAKAIRGKAVQHDHE